MGDVSGDKNGLRQRFVSELREFAIIGIYLWVCFSALRLYKAALSQAGHAQFLLLGTAAVKALILGKFILIGKAAKVRSRISPRVLLHKIMWKSLAFLLLLLAFTELEELIVGMVHGHTVAEFVARPCLQTVAPAVIMLLVLIPLISFQEIDHALGEGKLRRTLFGRTEVDQTQF